MHQRHLSPDLGVTGEVIIIRNISRSSDDSYECIADNGVPPAASRTIRVTVECTSSP